MIYNFYSDNMKHKKGLTLIELLAVIAILGVLVVFAVPNVLESYRKSKKHSFVNEAKTVYVESINEFSEQRIKGKKISLVSNEETSGYVLDLQNEKDLKYIVRLNENGEVTAFKLSNSEFCIVGVGNFLDKYSIDEIIELNNEEDIKKCEIKTYKDKETLTLNLNINVKDYPVEVEHNPKVIYLKYNDKWYDPNNQNITKIEIPKKKNYFFDGFKAKSNTVIDCEGNILLDNVGTGVFDNGVETTANASSSFSKKCINIKYNGGSGVSGSMDDTVYCYGEKKSLSENKFLKTGYNLDGWDGLGKKWNDQEELPLINDSNESDAKLVDFKVNRDSCEKTNIVKELNAVWDAKSFKVKLVSDYKGHKSDLKINEITVTYDGTYSELPTPNIKGYKFVGWYTEESNGTIVNKTDKVKILNDITLYARYDINGYVVSYNANGGSGTMQEQECLFGVTCKLANNSFSNNCHDFIGWKLDNKGDLISEGSIINNTDSNVLNYYAQWKPKTIETEFEKEVQSVTIQCSGTYLLEVWGGQGGNPASAISQDGHWSAHEGGLGGYSRGKKYLTEGTKLYIVVGGQGFSPKLTAVGFGYIDDTGGGGYNGGGLADNFNGSPGGGGGATHIALSPGTLAELENKKTDILIVAGGGGGGAQSVGGSGGGATGSCPGGGCAGSGTQTNPGSNTCMNSHYSGKFGRGGDSTYYNGAGGGGYYGGGGACNTYSYSGGGGSGYIGGVIDGYMETGVRKSHGLAKITLVE